MTRKKAGDLRVLFIGKKDDYYSGIAAQFIQLHFPNSKIVFSSRHIPFPEELFEWKGDYIISYLAQWIIPAALLSNAGIAAINFHPGPPAYPGIGCTNFALYNGEKEFGITCHHMQPMVDSGSIIAVRKFPILPDDTVYSLTHRCYAEIINLFYFIITGIIQGKELPKTDEAWLRKPYTRKQLDALCELTNDMDQAEINRRLKATTFGDKIWAYIKENNATS